MTRFSARTLEVTSAREGEHIVLKAPSPGLFLPSVVKGDLVTRGNAIGVLDVLGERTTLVATASGTVDSVETKTVSFGDALVTLDQSIKLAGDAGPADAATAAATGLVFKAPMSGRFYTRSAPDKPAFVEVGTELKTGSTVCLLEVMKTFNRVTYGGVGLPGSAKVTAILVADGADVTAGDPLLQLS